MLSCLLLFGSLLGSQGTYGLIRKLGLKKRNFSNALGDFSLSHSHASFQENHFQSPSGCCWECWKECLVAGCPSDANQLGLGKGCRYHAASSVAVEFHFRTSVYICQNIKIVKSYLLELPSIPRVQRSQHRTHQLIVRTYRAVVSLNIDSSNP